MTTAFLLAQSDSSLDTSDPYAVAALAIGALTLIYLLLIRPAKERRKQRRDPLNKPATQGRSLAAERSTERAMQSLVLDLESLSRRMGGELDAKAAKLEALLAEADVAIQQLSRATQSAAPVSQVDAAKAKAAELVKAVSAGKSGPADSGLAGIAAHRDIYDLADAGEPLDQIARKVKRPAGEIELILALRGS